MTRGRLTRAGVGAIVIALLMLAAGLMKTINLLILLGDLLLVLVILNVWLARRTAKALTVEAGDGRDAFAGQPTSRTLTVENHSPHNLVIRTRELTEAYEGRELAVTVPSSHPRRMRFEMLPLRRGQHLSAVQAVSGFPFGFVEFQRTIPLPRPLTVYPALGRIDREAMRRWLIRGGEGEVRRRRISHRQALPLAELRGVRPFRSGDSPRHIHWRSTARHGDLLVREYDSPESRDLVLLVEPWLPKNPDDGDAEHLEAALSMAATLIDIWCEGSESPRLTLVVPDVETLHGRASPALRRRMFAHLAGLAAASRIRFSPRSAALDSPRAVRLLVSSRPNPGPLAELLRESDGDWRRLSSRRPPAWYHPPQAVTG